MESRGTIQLDWKSHGSGIREGNSRDADSDESAVALIYVIRAAVLAMSAERGGFTLLAMLQRENGVGTWDVVVSATWLDPNDEKSLAYVNRSLGAVLSKRQSLDLSRTVILPSTSPAVQALVGKVRGACAILPLTIRDFEFDGVAIREGQILAIGGEDRGPIRVHKRRKSTLGTSAAFDASSTPSPDQSPTSEPPRTGA